MQQTVFQPHPDLSPTSQKRGQSSSIIFIALTLFALAGLMIGFAVGIITHKQQSTTPPKGTAITVTRPKTSPTAQIIQPYELGCPWIVGGYASSEVADGNTQYTLTAQAKDKSHGFNCPANGPVKVAGITFKLWLIRRFPGKQFTLPDSAKDTQANIQNPITGKANGKNFPEIPLTFATATPQVQQSNSQGQVTWKYTVPPSVQPGNYDLVILTDWSGQYYNWSWIELTIQKANNN